MIFGDNFENTFGQILKTTFTTCVGVTDAFLGVMTLSITTLILSALSMMTFRTTQ